MDVLLGLEFPTYNISLTVPVTGSMKKNILKKVGVPFTRLLDICSKKFKCEASGGWGPIYVGLNPSIINIIGYW